MNNDITTNDTTLELGEPPEENKPHWALPPASEIRAATPDVRAILYAETLARVAAAGEKIPGRGWPRAAVGVLSDLYAKHAPRLLAEAPDFAAKVKEGRAELPQSRAGCAAFCGGRTKKTSPIGDVLDVPFEKVSEPKPEPDAERQRFEKLKRVIHDKLDAFLEVGAALAEIRSAKLYRLAGFKTFEEFCQAEFSLSK